MINAMPFVVVVASHCRHIFVVLNFGKDFVLD